MTTKRTILAALKAMDREDKRQRRESEEPCYSVCTESAWWLEKKLGGSVHGYFIEDNPTAEAGQNEGGHDFLVVDGFIVDWWYSRYYEGPGVYDLKKDAKEVERLYGPSANWTECGEVKSLSGTAPQTDPCGDCFRWATKFAQKWPGSYVAHGVCTSGPHAWVEVIEPDTNGYPQVWVYDWQREVMGLGPMLFSDFRFQARPRQVKRYTPEEALAKAARSKHWGPWL